MSACTMRSISSMALLSTVLALGCDEDPTVDDSIAAVGPVRRYFVAADEVVWDYAPTGINKITGQPFDDVANVFVANGPDRIGKEYIKAIYREYTDETFTQLKARPARWRHTGILGPVVQAAVGDSIEFNFKNNTTRPVSVHAHGVFYDKGSEGAPYNDGTGPPQQADDAVPPGATYRYKWGVPDRAGPGPNDPSSILWMYHSHTDEVADTYAGLHGPIIITRAGMAKGDGSPKDVDREVITNFEVFDENSSPYLDANIEMFAGDPGSVDPDDDGFIESNLMHSINGYVYGNLPDLTMKLSTQAAPQRVRWYLMAMGTEVDLHTPHWHGNTTLVNGNRTDVAELLPASMLVADMKPDDPGTWLYHCHVNDHIIAGMLALYTVNP